MLAMTATGIVIGPPAASADPDPPRPDAPCAERLAGALTQLPDHGFWGRGVNRLYVHRGTGHYGFPLRVGVPAEYSLLQVHPTAF